MFDSFILSFFSLFFLSLIPRPSLGFFLLCSCFPFVSVLVDALERSKMTNKAKPVTKDPKKSASQYTLSGSQHRQNVREQF